MYTNTIFEFSFRQQNIQACVIIIVALYILSSRELSTLGGSWLHIKTGQEGEEEADQRIATIWLSSKARLGVSN